MTTVLQDAKALVKAYWAAVDGAALQDLQAKCRAHLPKGFRWQGPAPYTELHGPDVLAAEYLAPLKRAIPDLQRQTIIFMAGVSNGRKDGTGDGAVWVAGTGYMTGTAVSDFLGIPAGPRPLRLRWGEFLRVENGQIVQSQFLLDFVDWFEQIDRPVLPRPKGVPFVFPAPTGYDGLLTAPQDPAISQETLDFSRVFIYGGLNKFDKNDLSSMGMARFFHANLKWYGPGGIGGCLSLKEFEDLHQRPWLVAFPDRQVQDLDNLIAEDRMVGASSFPGVLATHTGVYLDTAATGNKIAFNGIDFWLKTEGKFTENWVFVDMIDLFNQFGVDLFARMRAHGGASVTMPDPKTLFAPMRHAMRDFAEAPVRAALQGVFTPEAVIHLSRPLGDMTGPDALYDRAFAPLLQALPDLERRDWIVMAGVDDDGKTWLGAGGHYIGTFARPWLDIAPTGHVVTMRYHEFYHFDGDKIVEMQAIWDVPEVMMQAGVWPLAPSLGREFFVPGPASQDGLAIVSDPATTTQSLTLVLDMLTAMVRHPSQGGPEVMDLPRYWHPRMNWYGPAGIGTGRGIAGFRNWHQIPFLSAMPDRGQRPHLTKAHFFGEGDYVAVTGWPNMAQTVSHGGWLGIAPTGQLITLSSLDFWRVEAGLIRENWVLIDLIDAFAQLGMNPLDRMREFNKARSGFDPETGRSLT